jgi:hypothetical protein
MLKKKVKKLLHLVLSILHLKTCILNYINLFVIVSHCTGQAPSACGLRR